MTQHSNRSNFSILFVDDEENSAKYFKKIFQQYYKVIATTSPIEALDILEQKSSEIAVIVTDQRMPEKTGVELLNKVKEKYPNIIRMLTTAFMNIDDNIAAINNSNIYGYIQKPWDINSVKYMLDKALTSFHTNLSLKSLSGSIAHEIRNPLNAVNLSLNQIQEFITDTQTKCPKANCLNSQISDMVNIAFSSIRRANDLIDKTLQSAQGKEINRNSFRYLKSQNLIQKALLEYGYSHKEEKDLIILDDTKTNEDFIIRGDETLFIFVLFNLLKNSLYYQTYKKDFKVNIQTSHDDVHNIITIKDNGPGIAHEDQKIIFENFITSNKINGTGLGLPFCKRIMESFLGSIECNSIEGEFCEFILKFPKIPTKDLERAKIESILQENEVKLKKQITVQFYCQDYNKRTEIHDILKASFPNITLSNVQTISDLNNSTDIILIEPDTKDIHKPNDITIPTIILENDITSSYESFDEIINSKNEHFEPKIIRSICKWNILDFIPPINHQNQQKKQTILIADDEQTSLLILKKILINNGYNVESCVSGEEAYGKYLKCDPTIVITDINMPQSDGTLVCTRIKEHESTKATSNKTPIICYGGDLDKEKIYAHLKHGFSDYFLKGNDTKHLIDLIRFYLA